MPSPRSTRRTLAALALAIPLRTLPWVAAAIAWPSAAHAQGDAYKQHMENGVKLFRDGNYPAAAAEFRAAYQARPSPNPLVNIALCEKALFHYPKAIDALETALAQHGDAMDPTDKRAAEDAIVEMRGLLGKVTVTVVPPHATVVVDGDELPASDVGRPIPLGPGVHKIEAHAPGFAPAQQSVTVVSKQAQEITLALVADQVPTPPPPPRKDEPPVTRGFYLLGLGSALFAVTHPNYFQEPKLDYGAAYGLRLGFQVNRVAGFDLSYEHSSISDTSKLDNSTSYRILSDRFAVGMRLISPGSLVRAVGSIAGGIVVDGIEYDPNPTPTTVPLKSICKPAPKTCPIADNPVGADAFGLVEIGAELDLDHVLIGLAFEAQFESTGNLQSKPKAVDGMTQQAIGIYGSKPIVNVGPALRVGYRFW